MQRGSTDPTDACAITTTLKARLAAMAPEQRAPIMAALHKRWSVLRAQVAATPAATSSAGEQDHGRDTPGSQGSFGRAKQQALAGAAAAAAPDGQPADNTVAAVVTDVVGRVISAAQEPDQVDGSCVAGGKRTGGDARGDDSAEAGGSGGLVGPAASTPAGSGLHGKAQTGGDLCTDLGLYGAVFQTKDAVEEVSCPPGRGGSLTLAATACASGSLRGRPRPGPTHHPSAARLSGCVERVHGGRCAMLETLPRASPRASPRCQPPPSAARDPWTSLMRLRATPLQALGEVAFDDIIAGPDDAFLDDLLGVGSLPDFMSDFPSGEPCRRGGRTQAEALLLVRIVPAVAPSSGHVPACDQRHWRQGQTRGGSRLW